MTVIGGIFWVLSFVLPRAGANLPVDPVWIKVGISVGDLFAAGEVAFIMAIGAILEDITTYRAPKGLKKLICLAPTQGCRITNGKEKMISAGQIKCGNTLRILLGETISVDGRIVNGETSVD